MADLIELKRIAQEAARIALGSQDVLDVEVEPGSGMDGDELFRLRIVVPNRRLTDILNDRFLEAVLGVKAAVRDSGDPRRVMVGLVTPSGQASRGDPES